MEIGGSIDSPSVTVGHVINFSKLLEKYFSQEYARFQAFLVYFRSRNDYGCRMRFLYFTGDFLNDLPKYQASQGLGEREVLRLKRGGRGGGRKGFKSSLSPLSLRNTRPSPAVHSLISAYLGLNFNPSFFSIYSKAFP